MKLPILCACGNICKIDTLLEGQPVACPKCGVANTLRIPVAGIPTSVTDGTILLPSWIIAPILGYLTLMSGLIVLAGWSLAQPAALATTSEDPIAAALIDDKPVTAVDESSANENPVAAAQVQSDTGPRLDGADVSFVLPRRMPSIANVPETINPLAQELKPAADEAVATPAIVWALEKPVIDVVQPIETAQRMTGDLHFSVRRLRLDGEAPRPLRLAVTPVGHDDVGSVLSRMGEGYRFTTIRNQDLMSLPILRNYDVVFLTCADLYAQDFHAALPLRKFVEQGGTLYASDLRGDLVLAAFPEFRARQPMSPGVPQTVEAKVVDPALQTHLGKKAIPLTFDAPGWRPAAFDLSKASVCLKGAYRNEQGQSQVVPLLVKFRAQRGTVIFTSFHHTNNDSEIVRKVLDYLVFASVNARSEARVRDLMRRYDFAPTDVRPTTLSSKEKTEAVHHHTGGGLQIALGFENQGAKLKLTLRSPSGQTIEHEDQGIYLIDVPHAAPGTWSYTVTPIELPHANFPILIAVGTPRS